MSDRDKYPDGISTMDWWVRYEGSSPGRTMTKEELGDYKSEYVKCWNLITDRGWKKIGKMWTSPDEKYRYNNVYDSYRCQMFLEMVEKKK